MRALIICSLVCLAVAEQPAQEKSEPPNSGPFELAGDKLGESLTSFTSKHPKAQCVDSTSKRKTCYQWEDVSIFGKTAHPEPKCSPEAHASPGCAQGLTAQFLEQRLVLLSYAVRGTDKSEATSAFKKKYGTPIIDTREATIWTISNTSLSVVVGKATEGKEGESLVTFVIQG